MRLRASVLPALASVLALASSLALAGPAGASEEPTTDPMAGAPAVGDCSTMTYEDHMGETVEDQVVACDRQHTTQVVHVGLLPEGTDYDSEDLWTVVFDACADDIDRIVPTDPLLRARTLLTPSAFIPTAEQREAGARWFRCDVALVGHDRQFRSVLLTQRIPLPEFDGSRIATKVGRCVTRYMTLTVCAKKHVWEHTGSYYARRMPTRPKRRAAELRELAIKRCPALTTTDRWVYSSVPRDKRTWVTICYSRS